MSLAGLFGRQVYVELGPEGVPSGVQLRDLRIGFKVSFKAGKATSTGTIRIWNPAPTSIAAIRLPKAVVRLFAGYDPLPRLLFVGSPTPAGITVDVEGGDQILQLDATDGGASYATTIVVSYATPTTLGQVLALVLAQTQWGRGMIGIPDSTPMFPHGVTIVGRPSEVMDRIAAAVPAPGADWFVRDGAVYVVPRGTSTPEAAPLLSSTQGNLIGSPTYGQKGQIKVRALIDATMRPGRAFVVQSVGVNGTYIASDIDFTGDSGYERDFYMDITAKPAGVP